MAYRLPKNLVKRRKSMGLTQQNIADILSLDRSSYSYYETGSTSPSIETLVRLARMFDVTVEELLGSNTKPKEMILNDDPDFSFKKGVVTKAPINYKRAMGKLLDLNEDELFIIDQEIDKLLKSRKSENN